MKLDTVEQLITRLKSIELSAHIWKWETPNASEIEAIDTFYNDLHYRMDQFIELTISDVGFKHGGFRLGAFPYRPISNVDIKEVAEEVKGFLQHKVRTPNGPFMPEIDAALVKIIKVLMNFNYKIMLG